MKRRVVKHGTSTLTISLPVQWVKKFEIKQGDELDVEERGNRIIIKPYDELIEKEIVININGKENIPKRMIMRYYIAGYNKIKIKYKHLESRAFISNLIRTYLMGFEIVEQGDDYFILKNIARGIEEEFDVMLNRLSIITISSLKDLHDAFLKNDLTILRDISSSEMNVNKIYLFCRRMLNLIGHKEKSPINLGIIIKYYECIMDSINYLSLYAIENNVKVSKDIIKYVKNLLTYSEIFHKSLNTDKTINFSEMKELEIKLSDDKYPLMEKCSVHERVIVSYLIEIHGILHHMSGEL